MVELYQPHSKALQHYMDDITCTVQFTDIWLKLFAEGIITLAELEELLKLDNKMPLHVW